MNFVFAQQINLHLERLDFDKSLEVAESSLKKLPKTQFHVIIGLSLTHQANNLADWIDDLALCEFTLLHHSLNLSYFYQVLNCPIFREGYTTTKG